VKKMLEEGTEEIKEDKMGELRQKMLQKQGEEQERLKAEMQLEAFLKSSLSPEAKNRLSNVRLANQELYAKAVQAIAFLAKSQGIRERISEQDLKSILARLSAKREIKIKRK